MIARHFLRFTVACWAIQCVAWAAEATLAQRNAWHGDNRQR